MHSHRHTPAVVYLTFPAVQSVVGLKQIKNCLWSDALQLSSQGWERSFLHKNPLFLPTAISKEMENSLILPWSHLHWWQINKSTPFFISSFYIKRRWWKRGGGEKKEWESGIEGTQADPLVSEIWLLMFGFGKWKLLWHVCSINPAFLFPGADRRNDGNKRFTGRTNTRQSHQKILKLIVTFSLIIINIPNSTKIEKSSLQTCSTF